jgi:hypothetical protein
LTLAAILNAIHRQSFNLPFNRLNRCGGLRSALGLGLKMTRTIWLASICLAALSALAVGKALMTRADSLITEGARDQTTVGTGLTQDALSKSDRLEITNVRQEVPAPPALRPAEPIVPAVSSVPPPIANKIISRHWHDPNAFLSGTKEKQTKQTALNKKSKTVDRKGNQAADRSKPAEPVKPCSHPGAFGDLLRSLNLSPACES